MSLPKKHHHQKQEGYRKIDFNYDRARDAYLCPQTQVMKPILKFKRGQKRTYSVTRYVTPNCQNCAVRDLCTSSIHGRHIEHPSHEDHVFRNNNRVNKTKDYFRRRQTFVELPFGTIKRHWHIDHAMVKGKKIVFTEYIISHRLQPVP